jgi:hypothetical protein
VEISIENILFKMVLGVVQAFLIWDMVSPCQPQYRKFGVAVSFAGYLVSVLWPPASLLGVILGWAMVLISRKKLNAWLLTKR